MPPLCPVPPALLIEQFATAPFACWLVNAQLNVLSVNEAVRKLYPGHCLPDGVRLFLAPADTDEIIAAIAQGTSMTKRPLLYLRGAALAFTPCATPEGDCCALVMLVPVSALVPAQNDSDPRRQLEGVGNLVVTQGIRRCMTDILAALGTANAALQAAGIKDADAQLQQINHSCYRLLRTADNLARNAQHATATVSGNAVSFWDCCAELLDASSTLLRAGRYDFSYSLPDSETYVDCDFEQMTSVILNLICNSFLYAQPGVHVTVTGRDVGERVVLTLSDNGPGLSAKMQKHLFQPFSSWESLEQSNAGTGLGLHLARALVAAAGGNLTLQTGDNGTTIAISLPTAPPADLPLPLGSSSHSYLRDRFSLLYLHLCDLIPPPTLS